jgi:carbamoyl-phosphate synthase large subunit
VLEKYGVKVIGVNVDAIERGEDRIEFKETMERSASKCPERGGLHGGGGRSGWPRKWAIRW